MIPGCPKCKKPPSGKEETWSPPFVAYKYVCCSKRREYYYDSFNGWESREARQKRLRIPTRCSKCKKSFFLPTAEIERNGVKRTEICTKCLDLAEKERHEKRVEHSKKISLLRKETNRKWGQM